MHRICMTVVGWLTWMTWALVMATPHAIEQPPNIVWIMADDLGWGEVELFPGDSKHGRLATPNLNKFGQEGTIFTQAYAGYTVCAPSRTTLFTGRHSGQFIKYGFDGQNLYHNQAHVRTAAQMLREAGYRTAAFGKTAPFQTPDSIAPLGFDHFKGQLSQLFCHNMYPIYYDYLPETGGSTGPNISQAFVAENNVTAKSREACMANPSAFNYSIDFFQDSALSWLDTYGAAPDKPFFLYVSYTIPHAGGWGSAPQAPENGAPVPSDGQYANRTGDWPTVEVDHAAVVTYLDARVGDILSKLQGLGIDNRTLVFFASDNGAHNEGGHDHTFFNSTGGLRGFKRSLYEGGVRTPAMARWPGRVPAGRVSNYSWAFWDFMPTVGDLVNGSWPSDIDGISILPELLGQEQAPKDYLFFTWGSGAKSGYGVRSGEWKGVVQTCNKNLQPSEEDSMELYHLPSDPFETNDVSQTHADVVTQLKALILPKNLSCTCFQC
ncbi:uncharacterized protein MONBRDRAFT_24876 [Monosiga brevicollis MX1]|uniref:Sulfatase N-terminal domain-containing protein n=1 Tax=Monosiga brevicollis TaxID=81824 RepID=A9UY05_MONBE|nr:uncharacterized protein MONBRDRAFT_24876 [Monosiga brevicollis MX1]EDQ89775.1 predicted protein [Monosiga brevicollis MX1]|eukprot:XP_001745197.1 hypothetical protein [Monosiga brevicollis MX1]